MKVTELPVSAFLDGYGFVTYNTTIDKLIVGNSEGIVKIFNIDEPDLEPTSIDIIENLTSLSSEGDRLLVTNTAGHLECVDLLKNESLGVIHRTELPLRDSIFINEGKRILCGGDDNKLFIIDQENDNGLSTITLPNQFLNVSYNSTGELLAVSLSNQDVQIYSVINETPNLIQTIPKVLIENIKISMDKPDYEDESTYAELLSTKTEWSMNGEFLAIATNDNSINIYNRSNWETPSKTLHNDDKPENVKIIDFRYSPLRNDYMAILYDNESIEFFNTKSSELVDTISFKASKPTSLTWNKDSLFVGTTKGHFVKLSNVSFPDTNGSNSKTAKLFVNNEAEESNDEENADDDDLVNEPNGKPVSHLEDSMIIDEDEEDQEDNPMKYYNKGADYILDDLSRKRQKTSNGYISKMNNRNPIQQEHEDIAPYSCGSTPWAKSDTGSNNSPNRRYLTMNSTGYVWSVRTNLGDGNLDQQQSISISFFDRKDNKDYYFTDYSGYDLCSMNSKGLVLATSGYKEKHSNHNGKLFYRNHDSINDSWDREVPLLKNEHLTSVSITGTSTGRNDGFIVVGSNLGYLRIFDFHGLCLNIMKTTPIVTLSISFTSVLFMINQVSPNLFTYSLIDLEDGYKYIQQNIFLPLKKSTNPSKPLLKGVFFNEHNDPCLVGGSDDTLLILESWRNTNNSRWLPILNCHDVLTENGTNESKKHWKCWPLGLYQDQLNCLILKNNQQYPGFPLPLPIELEIKIPSSVPKAKSSVDELFESDPSDKKLIETKHSENEAEETFLRVSSMGRVVFESSQDEEIMEDDVARDEIQERLELYSNEFERSLIKLFISACQDSRLSRATSIAKLMRKDQTLLGAAKVADRMQFSNLALKINKLRESMMSFEDEEDEEDQ